MNTQEPALFDTHIVGPIRSRRLGLSLGVNLLPLGRKVCTFDCLYCECGWTPRGGRRVGEEGGRPEETRLPDADAIIAQLEARLEQMSADGTLPDTITFAGNGEPTLHPRFAYAIDRTLALRDRYCPEARVSVLSNATRIGCPDVYRALMSIDAAILKIDAGTDTTARLIDRPLDPGYSLARVVEEMKAFRGRLTVQTMFVRGEADGQTVDNTTPAEAEAWRALVRRVAPAEVMVYSLDRPTPQRGLSKVPRAELEVLAAPLVAEGFNVQVTG